MQYDAEDRVDLVYHNLDYPCYTSTGYYYESVRYDYGYDDYSGNITSLGIGFTTDTADINIYPYYDNLGRLSSRTVRTTGFGSETYYDYETVTVDGVVYESARVSMYYGDMGDYQFVYDDNGNLTEIQLGGVHDGVAGETQYRYDYDSKGQLIREDNVPLNKTYTYTYDAAGNITAKRVYPFTTGALGIAEQTISYTYGDAQWGDLLTGWNGYTISYDGIGNPTLMETEDHTGYVFGWQGRRLASYTGIGDNTESIYFTYNADGIRTSKTVNGVEHQYILNGSQIIAERWTETVNGEPQEQLLLYLYDETGAPLGLAYHNEDYYENEYDRFFFHRSLQGDITAIYSNNRQIGSYTYDAWGNFTITQAEGNTALENLVLNTYNPFRYRGYYYDVETGLYYLQSRYYNPEWGRFISADGYLSTGQGILGYNMFAYCGNSPVLRVDYSGNLWISALVLTAVLAVVMIIPGSSSPVDPPPPTSDVGAAQPFVEMQGSSDPNSPNCYAYVNGSPTNEQPGQISGRYPSDWSDVTDVGASVVADYLAKGQSIRLLEGPNDKVYDNEYKIALRVGTKPYKYENGVPQYDYHFMVQTSSGQWAEKHGIGGNAQLGAVGMTPDTLPWTLWGYSYYDSPIIYYAVGQ